MSSDSKLLAAQIPGTAFALWWALASTAGGALAGGVECGVWWVGPLLFGLLLALPQALVLSMYRGAALVWLASSAIATPLGAVAATPVAAVTLVALAGFVGSDRGANGAQLILTPLMFLPGLAAGVVVGAIQFAAARRRLDGDLGRWLVASAMGGAAMAPIFAEPLLTLFSGHGVGCLPILGFPPPLAGLAGGSVYGAVTGLVLGAAFENMGGIGLARRKMAACVGAVLAVIVAASLATGFLLYDDSEWGTGRGSIDIGRVYAAGAGWAFEASQPTPADQAGMAVLPTGSFLLADPDRGLLLQMSGDSVQFEIPANKPSGVAVDSRGRIYVTDRALHRVLVLSATGEPIATWGQEGDGPGQFRSPVGIALDGEDHVYVADSGNHRVQVLSADGALLRQVGGPGGDPGQFQSPSSLAIGRGGALYVVDGLTGPDFRGTGLARVQKFSPDGALLQWVKVVSRFDNSGPWHGVRAITTAGRGEFFILDTAGNLTELTENLKPLFRWSVPRVPDCFQNSAAAVAQGRNVYMWRCGYIQRLLFV